MDKEEYSELLLSHYDYIKKCIYYISGKDKELAEDMAQDIWVQLRNKENFYDSKYGKFTTWLQKVIKNSYINYVRKSNPLRDSEGLELLYNVGETPNYERDFEADTIKNLINCLPIKQRDAVMMIANGYSFEDASKEISQPIGTVKSRVFRGREMVRNKLSKLNQLSITN